MKKKKLFSAICFLFSGLFLYSGITKLSNVEGFRAELDDSSALVSFARTLAWAIPVAEIFLAILLLIPALRLTALILSEFIMLLFTGYLLFFLDGSVSCACGGFIEQMGSIAHLFFNAFFLLFGLIGISQKILMNQKRAKLLFKHFKKIKILCAQSGKAENLN